MKRSSKPIGREKKTAATVIVVEQPGELLAWLIDQLPGKNRKLLKAVLRDRQVTVDGIPQSQFDHPLRTGQRVAISWQKRDEQPLQHGLRLVFEDDDLIVVDKPSGLLTVATDKEKRRTAYAALSEHVKRQDADNKIFIVHRLDQGTSGLLMFAKNQEVKHKIQKTWDATISQRTYVAVAEGLVDPPGGTVSSYLVETSAFKVYSSHNPKHGHKAVTHYRTMGTGNGYTLLEINLETGRKHQIRVHLQDIGYPVVGDKKYGSGAGPIGRLALHAKVLAFTHPTTGEPCRFETAMPPAFRKLVAERRQ